MQQIFICVHNGEKPAIVLTPLHIVSALRGFSVGKNILIYVHTNKELIIQDVR